MCRNRDAITQFIEYFRGHIADLDAVCLSYTGKFSMPRHLIR
jgi:hypothetical protein